MINYAQDYAEKVIDGRIIAGKKVILAAKRYLNDLKKAKTDDFPYFYDISAHRTGCENLADKARQVYHFSEILLH